MPSSDPRAGSAATAGAAVSVRAGAMTWSGERERDCMGRSVAATRARGHGGTPSTSLLLRLGLRPRAPDGLGDGGAGRDAELREHAREVLLDRLLGQEQLAGDLAVRPPAGDEVGDLALAAAERVEAARAGDAAAPARGGAPPRPSQGARGLRPGAPRPAAAPPGPP